jgi:hypothetical protein
MGQKQEKSDLSDESRRHHLEKQIGLSTRQKKSLMETAASGGKRLLRRKALAVREI